MATEISAIITFVNKALNESYAAAGILDEINFTLHDISKMANWPDLHRSGDDTVALSSGDKYIEFPANFKDLEYIIINDGTDDGGPLVEIEYKKLLKKYKDLSSSEYNEPLYYVKRGKKFWLWPICGASYTAKLHFWRYHPAIADDGTILFADDFDTVIKAGVCFRVAVTHKKTGYIEIWSPLYSSEKAKMKPADDKRKTVAKYHDL